MPAHASRTLAPSLSAPSGAERGLLAPLRPRRRLANAGTPAELSASPASRPVKLRSVDSGLGAWTGPRRLAVLPPSMQERWREIIVASPGDDMMFPSMLKRDPELCADWLRAWFRRVSEPNHYEHLREDLKEVITEMPAELRKSLLDDVPAGVAGWLLLDVIQRLVSDDLDITAALFEKPDLEQLGDAALRGGPSEPWMERALLALDHGWEPERIVYPTRPNSLSWSGDLSDVWRGKIDDFERLRLDTDPVDAERRERIISAGVAYFEQLRDEAAAQERTRRVYGRNAG